MEQLLGFDQQLLSLLTLGNIVEQRQHCRRAIPFNWLNPQINDHHRVIRAHDLSIDRQARLKGKAKWAALHLISTPAKQAQRSFIGKKHRTGEIEHKQGIGIIGHDCLQRSLVRIWRRTISSAVWFGSRRIVLHCGNLPHTQPVPLERRKLIGWRSISGGFVALVIAEHRTQPVNLARRNVGKLPRQDAGDIAEGPANMHATAIDGKFANVFIVA